MKDTVGSIAESERQVESAARQMEQLSGIETAFLQIINDFSPLLEEKSM